MPVLSFPAHSRRSVLVHIASRLDLSRNRCGHNCLLAHEQRAGSASLATHLRRTHSCRAATSCSRCTRRRRGTGCRAARRTRPAMDRQARRHAHAHGHTGTPAHRLTSTRRNVAGGTVGGRQPRGPGVRLPRPAPCSRDATLTATSTAIHSVPLYRGRDCYTYCFVVPSSRARPCPAPPSPLPRTANGAWCTLLYSSKTPAPWRR